MFTNTFIFLAAGGVFLLALIAAVLLTVFSKKRTNRSDDASVSSHMGGVPRDNTGPL